MRAAHDPSGLDPDLADRALDRLGLPAPPPADLGGLADLYAAWCRLVPFDNVRKLIALHRPDPGPLPGLDVDDFFTSWLDHGVGGTCWPSSWALTSLARRCGFDAREVAASMFDVGIPSHGTTIVTIDGDEWLIDSSMLFGSPLPLDPAGPTSVEDPTGRTTAAPVPEGWLLAFVRSDDGGDTIPCRTISPAAVEHAFCASRYEWSRENSPFNQQVNMRRHRGDATLAYGLGRRFVRAGDHVDGTDLRGDALRRALVEEMGVSAAITDELFAVADLS